MRLPLKTWLDDCGASLLGGLAAIPAAAGLALASGLPLHAVVVTALVGCGVVSFFCRHRFQFHGPATSLILASMLALKLAGPFGLAMAVVLAGVIQVAAGLLRIGWWVQILPPNVISGLLSGIGAIVLLKQGEALGKSPGSSEAPVVAVLLCGLTVALMAFWPRLAARFGPSWSRKVPGAIVALVVVTALAHAFALGSVQTAALELSLTSAPDFWVQPLRWSALTWHLLAIAGSLALLSGSKALVVAVSLTRQDRDLRIDFNRELMVLGLGNMVTGLVGGLPLTAHVDRSQFTRLVGGRTRMATVLQGVWIALILSLAPALIAAVPVAAFAGVIVYSSCRLIDWRQVRALLRARPDDERWLFLGTVAATIAFDLTAGVLTGLLLGMLRLASKFAATAEIRVTRASGHDDLVVLFLKGAFTFVCLPRLVQVAKELAPDAVVVLDTKEVYYIDHACLSFFEELKGNQTAGGGALVFDTSELVKKSATPLNLRTEVLNELRGTDRRKERRSENVGRRKLDHILAQSEEGPGRSDLREAG